MACSLPSGHEENNYKEYTMQDSTPDTLAHRQMVVDFATDFCSDIMDRAERHDESKLHEPEKERFDYVGTHQHLSKHEMWCDWCAACKRNKGGNIRQSLEVNRERFGLSDQLYNILLNTAEAMDNGVA